MQSGICYSLSARMHSGRRVLYLRTPPVRIFDWCGGKPDSEFRRYAARFWELAETEPEAAMFPEALLQRVDDDWLTEAPSAAEAFVYSANEPYIRWLLSQLGSSRT